MDDAARPTGAAIGRPPLISLPAIGLRQLRSTLAGKPFLKNVSIMLTGAAGGQIVSVLLSPALTRLYSPQQFGVLSIYTAILTILVVLASLRYEITLPLAASDEDAVNLVAVCFCALIATTIVIAIASYWFPEEILQSLWPTPINSAHMGIYRGLMIVGFLSLGAYFIPLYLATRQGAFPAVARTRVAQGVVGPVTQIGFGLAGAGAPGLLLGSILGQSAGTFGLLYELLGKRTVLLRSLSWQRMRTLAWRYRRFPLIASWAALIDAAGGNQLLYLLVSVEYSARIAGFIFLAERIVARPLTLVGTSILQVFVGEAGKTVSADPAKLRSRFYQVTSRQALLAIVWIVIANVAAAALFQTVFGADWGDAVVYLQAMSLAYLAQAIVLPVFHTLQILEKQSIAAGWQIGRLLLTIASLGLCMHFDVTAPWAIFCYSLVQAFSCALLLVLMAQSIQRVQR
jgi:O-antigen/teichoic acid export membrane protein